MQCPFAKAEEHDDISGGPELDEPDEAPPGLPTVPAIEKKRAKARSVMEEAEQLLRELEAKRAEVRATVGAAVDLPPYEEDVREVERGIPVGTPASPEPLGNVAGGMPPRPTPGPKPPPVPSVAARPLSGLEGVLARPGQVYGRVPARTAAVAINHQTPPAPLAA